MALLELDKIVAGYLKNVDVLQGVSLCVEEGEVVCLIGPNGAGKSTVLRTISGLLTPTAGTVIYDGASIAGTRPDLILKLGIAHVPQGHSSFPEMSVHENLIIGAYAMRNKTERRRRLDRVYELFPMFAARKTQRAGNLSGGQQKMLEIGRALMMDPRIMLLDEPSLGLAPKLTQMVFETIQELNHYAGTTILMVEQNARSALGIADRAYVLELGKERLEGEASGLLDDPMVARLYLGGGVEEEKSLEQESSPG
ncbi:MAG TPA: ABC transporter ATP-binding protein [Acidimicrobiia bacterium]|nr:ABC transporter ATP-binding protein [Acidimicrobiia bacterium]